MEVRCTPDSINPSICKMKPTLMLLSCLALAGFPAIGMADYSCANTANAALEKPSHENWQRAKVALSSTACLYEWLSGLEKTDIAKVTPLFRELIQASTSSPASKIGRNLHIDEEGGYYIQLSQIGSFVDFDYVSGKSAKEQMASGYAPTMRDGYPLHVCLINEELKIGIELLKGELADLDPEYGELKCWRTSSTSKYWVDRVSAMGER